VKVFFKIPQNAFAQVRQVRLSQQFVDAVVRNIRTFLRHSAAFENGKYRPYYFTPDLLTSRGLRRQIASLSPQLVTFNGSSFDLPVLRYRAMVHGVAAPGLAARPYFNRYTEDALDLCDVLSSFSSQAKATLHELSRVMGLPGKPDGINGADVERYYLDGRIR